MLPVPRCGRRTSDGMDLGLLYGHKKRFIDARDYIARSIDLFDRCGADVLLDEARAALDDLPR